MSVKRRGRGFEYRFTFKGVIHSGTVQIPKGTPKNREAAYYRKAEKEEIKALGKARAAWDVIHGSRSVRALAENCRKELTGSTGILLKDAFELAAAKPHKKHRTQRTIDGWRSCFQDFTAFMASKYPEVEKLSDVTHQHTEEWVAYLIENGRFAPNPFQVKLLSPTSIRYYAHGAQRVFLLLERDAGLLEDPFKGIELPQMAAIARDIFTDEELSLIAAGIVEDHKEALKKCVYRGTQKREAWLDAAKIVRPLMILAPLTALTEGDICTLKRSNVDFKSGMIYRNRNKTGVGSCIPILPACESYLKSLDLSDDPDSYILPELAELYLNDRTRVSYRVKFFLNGLGIKTTVVPAEGRKAQSVKDCHSFRHVYCYLAGKAGIPIPIVQSIVGHMTPEMTKHYMQHVTEQDIKAAATLMTGALMPLNPPALPEPDNLKEQVKSALDNVDPETLKDLLALLKQKGGKR